MFTYPLPTQAGDSSPITLTNPVFLADLHLSAEVPAIVSGFLRFLETDALAYDEILLLGDIFDAWIGDDARDEWEAVQTRCLALKAQGKRLYLMQGNRDFMMGKDLAKAWGATLLADPVIATIKGKRYLLSHGDQWCTNDVTYQAARVRIRRAWWQAMILSLPRGIRAGIARRAREKSRAHQKSTTVTLMDVTPSAIEAAIQTHNVDGLIHGHTHRPAEHTLAEGHTRWVLPDWREKDHVLTQAGYLALDAQSPSGFALVSLLKESP